MRSLPSTYLFQYEISLQLLDVVPFLSSPQCLQIRVRNFESMVDDTTPNLVHTVSCDHANQVAQHPALLLHLWNLKSTLGSMQQLLLPSPHTCRVCYMGQLWSGISLKIGVRITFLNSAYISMPLHQKNVCSLLSILSPHQSWCTVQPTEFAQCNEHWDQGEYYQHAQIHYLR
jgi:hypothetical protein